MVNKHILLELFMIILSNKPFNKITCGYWIIKFELVLLHFTWDNESQVVRLTHGMTVIERFF